jgi:hypothetical protein
MAYWTFELYVEKGLALFDRYEFNLNSLCSIYYGTPKPNLMEIRSVIPTYLFFVGWDLNPLRSLFQVP